MDREYLEEYEQKEKGEFERLLKDISEDKFSFEDDRFPPDERFVKIQEPVAVMSLEAATRGNCWTQIPFCGSLIILLQAFPRHIYEEYFFKLSEIPKIIDFIKETGRLQVALSDLPTQYEGLDFLEPFFEQLKPPVNFGVPFSILGSEEEIRDARNVFFTIGKVSFFNFLRHQSQEFFPRSYQFHVRLSLQTYTALKIGHYPVVEDIENLIVDDPEKAFFLLTSYRMFIVEPLREMRADLTNFALEEIKCAQDLPLTYQPSEIRFPCEIGKFLLKKLTYAPKGLRACNELIDHYNTYDLQKVLESLNEAIVTNHPDIVNESSKDLSQILENVWNDRTIPRQIKNLRRGLPISIAAIGPAVATFVRGLEGFLAGLGFSVGAKFLDVEIEGLSERIAKWLTKSYQANVYDFKKKYKGKIVH